MNAATSDGVMPFPDEIIQIICEFAAEQDQSTAYALALTSKQVCKWTAKARWRTISITSPRQLISLWSIIYALPKEIVEGFWKLYDAQEELQRGGTWSEKTVTELYPLQVIVERLGESKRRKVDGISFPPGGHPHVYVKNLFFDLVNDRAVGDKSSRMFFQICTSFFEILLGGIWPEGLALNPLYLLQRWNGESSSVLETVSIGPLEALHLNHRCGPDLPIKEMTITVNETSERLALNHTLPVSLQRLHLIGASVDSPLSGMTPPWSLFKSLCTPYMGDPTSKTSKRRLTHIRYDTRRFSFKPAEITAKRMGPLFRELTLSPSDTHQTTHTTAKEATASFQFDGPRHAAPSKGSGNVARLQSTTNLVSIHKLAQQGDPIAQYMCNIGIGQLAFLQFAWEPMTGSKEMLESVQPWYKRNADSADTSQQNETDSREDGRQHGMRDETGGWPRERRGAWTERSEKSIDSFGAEMREAIESQWGWHGDGIEAAGRYCRQSEENIEDGTTRDPFERNSAFTPDGDTLSKEKIESRPDLYNSEIAEMQKVTALIRQKFPNCNLSHPNFANDSESPLCFGIRAPRSLVHLGGKASFTYHDRLRLFYDRANGGKGAWP
ncbi:uncharacterized protein FA14DRAFT_64251 [Meira miltonrushii]|uniref:Uncharacterized protein n=1 Tax=Meira miltonrushii TaxID=1280837 RepID=A0A316VCE1_9BASI|nr:uncharacterized protein FA14DRAFT_64251 [Meira miltonrushii]PWN33651.1 hypothetical protein FA14DRAFT_64251 [Meira miltonrushii]